MHTIPRPCSVPGCRSSTCGYGQYCQYHRNTARRTGHPLQRSIRVSQLLPFEEAVDRYRQRHPEQAFWVALEEAWKSFVRDCAMPGSFGYGHRNSHVNEAAEVVRNLGLKVPTWVVCRTMLAVFLM